MNNDKQASESSHSPTEQPGDAKLSIEINNAPNVGSSRRFYLQDEKGWIHAWCETREFAELIARAPALLSEVSTLRSKQDELVAENEKLRDERNGLRYDLFHVTAERDELNNAIAHVWKALGITDYTGKHISEHVSELRSERDKMREENSND